MLRGAAQIPPLLAQLKQQAGNGLSLCRRGDAVRAANTTSTASTSISACPALTAPRHSDPRPSPCCLDTPWNGARFYQRAERVRVSTGEQWPRPRASPTGSLSLSLASPRLTRTPSIRCRGLSGLAHRHALPNSWIWDSTRSLIRAMRLLQQALWRGQVKVGSQDGVKPGLFDALVSAGAHICETGKRRPRTGRG